MYLTISLAVLRQTVRQNSVTTVFNHMALKGI
jgi:hypothetical protein